MVADWYKGNSYRHMTYVAVVRDAMWCVAQVGYPGVSWASGYGISSGRQLPKTMSRLSRSTRVEKETVNYQVW